VIQAESSTDQEIHRLLVTKSQALSSFHSFLLHCPVLLTQESLDRFKNHYHSLLKLAVTLSKKETDFLVYVVIARVMAVADALPTIDHMPGRKELSPHVIRNWKSAKNVGRMKRR
jgi:hypothetical protein